MQASDSTSQEEEYFSEIKAEDIFNSILFIQTPDYTSKKQKEDLNISEIPEVEYNSPRKSQISNDKSENESPLRNCLTNELLKTLNGSTPENRSRNNSAEKDTINEISLFDQTTSCTKYKSSQEETSKENEEKETIKEKNKREVKPFTQTKLNLNAKSFVPRKEKKKIVSVNPPQEPSTVNFEDKKDFLVNDFDTRVKINFKKLHQFSVFGQSPLNDSVIKKFHNGYPIGAYTYQPMGFPKIYKDVKVSNFNDFQCPKVEKNMNKIELKKEENSFKKEENLRKDEVKKEIKKEDEYFLKPLKFIDNKKETEEAKEEISSAEPKSHNIKFSQPQKKYSKKALKEQKKKKIEERDGDWNCYKCKNLNFAFRHYCNRCHTSKKETDDYNIKKADYMLDNFDIIFSSNNGPLQVKVEENENGKDGEKEGEKVK